MGEIFNDPNDIMVPEFELHDMGRFDCIIYRGQESNDRARMFQLIAKTLRDHIKAQTFFCSRDFFRIRQLKKDLAGVCNQLDDVTHESRQQAKKIMKLEAEISELREQKHSLLCHQVEAIYSAEQACAQLLEHAASGRRTDDDIDGVGQRLERAEQLEQENAELIDQLTSLRRRLDGTQQLEQQNAEISEQLRTLTQRLGLAQQLEQENAELIGELITLRERLERAQHLEQENAELIDQVGGLSNALVQVSLERDRRCSFDKKWLIWSCVIPLLLIVVGCVTSSLLT